MIQVITRTRYAELYDRMSRSARDTANGPVSFVKMVDEKGDMRVAESYNLLGATSTGDILLFCHDDVIFLSEGWDEKISEAIELGFNVVGAVGSKEYNGGMVFDAGSIHSAGKVVGNHNGKRIVKLMEHRSEIEPVKVIDGMFMAIDREHFLKTGFDSTFDGLWFYDLDFCLRSKCAVVDILVAHEKPANLYGVYPEGMRPMSDYEGAFNKKHGFEKQFIGNQRCDSMLLEDYLKVPA